MIILLLREFWNLAPVLISPGEHSDDLRCAAAKRSTTAVH